MWWVQWPLLLPEITLAAGACVLLILDLYLPKSDRRTVYFLTQLLVITTLIWVVRLLPTSRQVLFSGMFVVDSLSVVFKMVLLLFASMIFTYSRHYILVRGHSQGEYFVLCLCSILGMMILISAAHFLPLYLGLELLVLPLYALIAKFKEQTNTIEAAMKYFVMGALASGMMLYGISLLYGMTQSLDFYHVSAGVLDQMSSPRIAVLFGVVLVTVGIAFKLGAVPFHVWIPDVYQGSATCITLFISVLPKIAAVAMAIRVFDGVFVSLQAYNQHLLLALIVASLVVGNLGAIMQKNIKRMLGYSAIAHVGFILMGLLVGRAVGYQALIVYVMVYAFIILATFAVILILSKQNFECENLQDFHGLSQRHPWLAFLMMLSMLSLAGIPPLVGFYAKFVVLQATINAGFLWLAVFALAWSVVGAFYYLRVIKVMYFDSPMTEYFHDARGTALPHSANALISCHGLGLLLLGVFPTPVLRLATVALAAF